METVGSSHIDLHHCKATQSFGRCCGTTGRFYELLLAENSSRIYKMELKEYPQVGKSGKVTSSQSIHLILEDF